ncbi:hypothetical protein EFT87_10645 [Schleiferilactobacillus harbinensis]|jgi:hypothetical protein|nr:hypothetical protein [Schleiferilactobacillus harbinensis]
MRALTDGVQQDVKKYSEVEETAGVTKIMELDRQLVTGHQVGNICPLKYTLTKVNVILVS